MHNDRVERDLVTTIIPVFNRPAMLREAVASVLSQTYRPIEIIIVDDASTDDTRDVADELARRHPEIRLVHQNVNGGSGLAREAGRVLARGEFVQHLDSDDLVLPRKFELQVAALRAHQECGATYGIARWRFADGSLDAKPWGRTGERIETMFPAMLLSRWWPTPAPLYRKSLIDAAGPWLPLRIEEDWEYDARIAAQHVRLCFVDEEVAEVRSHGEANISGHPHNEWRLRDRARAHELILEHARRAGIAQNAPEMRHFARELFLLARQCGAVGLAEESKRLFTLARDASGEDGDRLQFRLYGALARVAGWRTLGKLATMSDRLRWRKSRS